MYARKGANFPAKSMRGRNKFKKRETLGGKRGVGGRPGINEFWGTRKNREMFRFGKEVTGGGGGAHRNENKLKEK